MSSRVTTWTALLAAVAVAAVSGAAVSREHAAAFDRKLAQVAERGGIGLRGAPQGASRIAFSESEVNSWFAYRGQEVLPTGVTAPEVTIVGNGRLRAVATVDVDALAKRRSTGRLLDPWSYLGGKVPVTVSGILHTRDGNGRFELESAALSGVPVPTSLLQDIVSYYSRSDDVPEGIRLDSPFTLPAQIRQIEVAPGQAVVVQ